MDVVHTVTAAETTDVKFLLSYIFVRNWFHWMKSCVRPLMKTFTPLWRKCIHLYLLMWKLWQWHKTVSTETQMYLLRLQRPLAVIWNLARRKTENTFYRTIKSSGVSGDTSYLQFQISEIHQRLLDPIPIRLLTEVLPLFNAFDPALLLDFWISVDSLLRLTI